METWELILTGLMLGYGTGILTGFFGAGGGFILTPALNILLGIPMNFAVGTGSAQVMASSAISLYKGGFSLRSYGVRVAGAVACGIPVGSFIGTHAVSVLKNHENIIMGSREINFADVILLSSFAVFLLLLSLWMTYDNFFRRAQTSEDDHKGLLADCLIPPLGRFRTIQSGAFSITVLAGLGIFTGFLSGLMGIGGGVMMMPALYYLVGQKTEHAIQTSTILVFISGLFSTIFHAADGNVDYYLASVLIFGAWFGAAHGIRLQKQCSGLSIRKYFVFVVASAFIMAVFKICRFFI